MTELSPQPIGTPMPTPIQPSFRGDSGAEIPAEVQLPPVTEAGPVAPSPQSHYDLVAAANSGDSFTRSA